MHITRLWQKITSSDLKVLMLLALTKLVLHLFTNGQYGFHRDELGMLNDARYLGWGYVSYPPFTPFVAHTALAFFGPSLIGLRFFAALGQSIAMLLTGLMAHDLGASRRFQMVAALAVATAPISLSWSSMFHYGGFDYLWWVLISYLIVRLLKSEDDRYWLGMGAVIGIGMLTKYTMALCVVGIVVGVLLTRLRHYLTSPWLWGGVGLSIMIFLPNIIWQVQHQYIHFEFLRFIHARDIRIGRTDGFLLNQLYIPVNPVTIPLWMAGLYFYFISPSGRRYRILGWIAVVAFTLFLLLQSRDYYTGPLYPALFAGGAAFAEQQLASSSPTRARNLIAPSWISFVISGVLICALILPVAPINSIWWKLARAVYSEPKEEVGWPDLVRTVRNIYTSLPADERARTGILTNYSEIGALYVYGSSYRLPPAIGGENSDWLRGYGNPPPETLIVVAWTREDVDPFFKTCSLVGQVTNSYGVQNEDTLYRHDIFLCSGLRATWPEFWREIQSFG